MVQIVSKILPDLSHNAQSESELKSALVVVLGEGVSEAVWAALREAREDVAAVANKGDEGTATSVLANLHALQVALDATKGDATRSKWIGLLGKIANQRVRGKHKRCN